MSFPTALGHWLRSGWCGMTILGLSVLARGLCYLPPVIPEGHKIPALETALPLQAWTALWLIIGTLTLLCAAGRRAMAPMVGMCIGVHMLWACLYVGAWIMGNSPRGYITALSYVTISLIGLWAFGRGERTEVSVRIKKE